MGEWMDGAEEQQKLDQRELPLPENPPFLLCQEYSDSWDLLYWLLRT